MDIIILDSWLKDHLKTKAKPKEIAECLSLCGPSVERVTIEKEDATYNIEITTNRTDSASHYGIAREAVAILPQFKIEASLNPLKAKAKQKLVKKVSYLDVEVDHKLCSRFTAVLIKDVVLQPSPKIIQERLTAVGLRPINNVVDISNYLMLDLGQPVHTFDYDKITKAKMKLRASKKGEKIITLDDKEHELPGGDIIIEDGEGRNIDLCGIMGGKLSAIDENTKNVLLFVQTYNPTNIRRTSMALSHRTDAAALFEKGLDPKQVEITIRRGIDMFETLTGGKAADEILDLYPNPYEEKSISLSLSFINDRLGVKINKDTVNNILDSLGFSTRWKNETLTVKIPSWRAQEVEIKEDILEEIARIYGYHNLPSTLMSGQIPDPVLNAPFAFEQKIREILKGWGGVEVYTLSLVAKNKVDLKGESSWVLKLKNPLGSDSEYLRLSLAPSLIDAVRINSHDKNPFHLFEIANVYLPIRGELPEEKMMLGGILVNLDWEQGKGIVEGLLKQLGVNTNQIQTEATGFEQMHHVSMSQGKETVGQYGILENTNYFYYEFDTLILQKNAKPLSSFTPIPKYPPQVEDLTFNWISKVLVGDVIEQIRKVDHQVAEVLYLGSFENSKTFRVTYQNKEKTLTNSDVELIRNSVLDVLKEKFGITLKL